MFDSNYFTDGWFQKVLHKWQRSNGEWNNSFEEWLKTASEKSYKTFKVRNKILVSFFCLVSLSNNKNLFVVSISQRLKAIYLWNRETGS